MRLLKRISESDADNNIYTWWNRNIDVHVDRSACLVYGSFIFMTVSTIVWGAFRSLECLKKNDKTLYEKMTIKEAALYPIRISCFLLSMYHIIENSSKSKDLELLNLLYTGIFFKQAISAMICLFSISDMCKQRFSTYDDICVILCSMLFGWYILNKHWIAHNLIGIAYSVWTIERLHLNTVLTGCIILGGMLIYDIVWVFGTNVMTTVAEAINTPVELFFPVDLLEKGMSANRFAKLGLGDIILPGKFIALLFRFDNSFSRKSRKYFNTSIFAYIFGLLATFFAMNKYNHAQPALLYLVPACVGAPLLLALIKGDIKAMFQYEDHPSDDKDNSIDGNGKGNSGGGDSKKNK